MDLKVEVASTRRIEMVDYMLIANDPETGETVHRWLLDDFTHETFERLFNQSRVYDDPVPVLSRQKKKLEERFGLKIDLNSYEYYVQYLEKDREAKLLMGDLVNAMEGDDRVHLDLAIRRAKEYLQEIKNT